jgi:hypothetical protein
MKLVTRIVRAELALTGPHLARVRAARLRSRLASGPGYDAARSGAVDAAPMSRVLRATTR